MASDNATTAQPNVSRDHLTRAILALLLATALWTLHHRAPQLFHEKVAVSVYIFLLASFLVVGAGNLLLAFDLSREKADRILGPLVDLLVPLPAAAGGLSSAARLPSLVLGIIIALIATSRAIQQEPDGQKQLSQAPLCSGAAPTPTGDQAARALAALIPRISTICSTPFDVHVAEVTHAPDPALAQALASLSASVEALNRMVAKKLERAPVTPVPVTVDFAPVVAKLEAVHDDLAPLSSIDIGVAKVATAVSSSAEASLEPLNGTRQDVSSLYRLNECLAHLSLGQRVKARLWGVDDSTCPTTAPVAGPVHEALTAAIQPGAVLVQH